MHTIFAGIHVQNNAHELLPLRNIDFNKNIKYLRELIATELKYDAQELEIIYNGRVLGDDLQVLSTLMQPNATVHCFRKTKKYTPYVPPPTIDVKRVQELFTLTAHIQWTVSSRVNVLNKILSEYPEFRRNLGAQALIRDSVLFNTLHEPQVIENISKHYPIICEAAPFIVDTIRKELARNSSATNFSEQAASDSTTSSEEENSLGASGSSGSETNRSTSSTNVRDELATIRQISRQQLANALAQVGMGSFNSLSNIAQRNIADGNVSEATIGNSTSEGTVVGSNSNSTNSLLAAGTSNAQDRISSEIFRQELQRAFESISRGTERMDTSETPTSTAAEQVNASGDNSDILPRDYRQHQFAEQLRIMAQMGFTNHAQNLNYLAMADGNIENALNLLMLGMNS